MSIARITPNTALGSSPASICGLCSQPFRKPHAARQYQLRQISAYGYTQAKALVYSKYGEPKDVLHLHTHSLSPAHGENLTLRFLASPINPADINQIQGTYASRPQFTTDLGTPQPSAIPGNEALAEVVSTGSSVKGLKKGDWVLIARTGFGTWRTHATATESDVIRIEKEGLTKIQAATVTVNPITAYRMLRDFHSLKEGEWWIQNGANSGVGRAAIQLGRRWGYKSINIVRARPGIDKLKAELEELGADIILTEDEVLNGRFKERVNEITSGGREKVMLALNCVGGKPTSALLKGLSPGAHVVTYGAMSKQPLVIPPSALIFNDIHFHGFWVSKWGDHHPKEKRRTIEEVLDMYQRKEFKDQPAREVEWGWDTKEDVLKEEVQGTLEGFRDGKGILVFRDEY